MKLALCIIVEGDKKLNDLKIAVNSAVSFVDGVFITTNGKEVEETKKWCEENSYNYSHLDWNKDFASQRNFNFAQVPKEYDFIFWLDSDDQLIGGEYLKTVANIIDKQGKDELFLTYWYGCAFEGERVYENLTEIHLYHQRERLFRPNRMKWVGRIHETPVPVDGIDVKYSQIIHTLDNPNRDFPIAVLHRDATMDSKEKNLEREQRNLEMLEEQLEDEIKLNKIDPRTVLYLMKIYANFDDEKMLLKCIKLGEQYLQTSGWDEERATAYSLLSMCFSKLNEPKRAKQMLLGALDEYPHDQGIYLKLAGVSFDLKRYKDMKIYMDIAENIKVDHTTAGNRNIFDNKFQLEMLKLKYAFNVEKNVDSALEAAKKIYEMQPYDENKDQLDYIEDLKLYNDASRNIDQFVKYLSDSKMYKDIEKLIGVFPAKFRELPFFSRIYNKFAKPRVWGNKEICYYASFGGPHFEKWDATSIEKGIGGSETAVIKLAQHWTELGYKVTVFGDPIKEGIYNGVTYLSYRRFNPKDRFNIFIQWRSNFLANRINSKRFYVDLHDIWSEVEYLDNLDQIDKIFVKSEYQMNLAANIPKEKFVVISNGI